MLWENLERLKKRIEDACQRSGRSFNEITLVCVTKNVDIEKIKEVIKLGIKDIGENRVQEAVKKFEELRIANCEKVRWHMVGHLQRNKAKYAVRIFDLIHSVDSLDLALELNKQAEKVNRVQDILIQVNVSGEETKFGINPENLLSLVKEILNLKNLNLKGLMTIAPIVKNPEDARPHFRTLRELKDKINAELILNPPLSVLSMGMSQDFEVAIEEGATMIRIGTAIFK